MRRRFCSSALVRVSLPLLTFVLAASAASAQSPARSANKTSQLTAPGLPSPGTPSAPPVDVPKSTTPPQPSSAQPVLPEARSPAPEKPTSPVVERIVRDKPPPLEVRKGPRRRTVVVRQTRRYTAGRRRSPGRVFDRPALAGVELVAPLLPPPEGPHVSVPTPAYPVESVLARITTPPPPIRCHPTRRDPYAPDPRLYREVPVQCEAEED